MYILTLQKLPDISRNYCRNINIFLGYFQPQYAPVLSVSVVYISWVNSSVICKSYTPKIPTFIFLLFIVEISESTQILIIPHLVVPAVWPKFKSFWDHFFLVLILIILFSPLNIKTSLHPLIREYNQNKWKTNIGAVWCQTYHRLLKLMIFSPEWMLSQVLKVALGRLSN